MAQLPVLTELVVSIVGGIITAAILGVFSRGNGSASRSTASVPVGQDRGTAGARRPSGVGSFLRMLIAVCGGVALSLFFSRMLIQAGVLPRGLPTRLGLLVVSTALIWLVLPIGRSRR